MQAPFLMCGKEYIIIENKIGLNHYFTGKPIKARG